MSSAAWDTSEAEALDWLVGAADGTAAPFVRVPGVASAALAAVPGLVEGMTSLIEAIALGPTIAEAAESPLPPPAPPVTRCGFFTPSGVVVSETAVRDAVRAVAVDERAQWLNAAGTQLLREHEPLKFGRLVRYWLGRYSQIPPSILTTLQGAATGPGVAYGALLVPQANQAQVQAAVAAVRATLLGALTVPPAPANLGALIDRAAVHARESARDQVAWSGVFVSDCVRQAGRNLGLESDPGGVHQGRDDLLLGHDGHRIYVAEAYRRRFGQAPRSATYHAFEPADRAVRIGDVVIQDRQANTGAQVSRFPDIPSMPQQGRQLHGDIVVELAQGQATTIGGNVGHSVRRRRYPLEADGRLVVSRQERFTQENDQMVLPAVPDIDPGQGLSPRSTGRIFAVLSPVEICVLVPGQRMLGGVLA